MKHSMPINDEERGLQYVIATISKDDSNGIAAKSVSNGSLPEVCQLKPETGIVKSIGHDGGWGWVIVGCAFCITAIVGGSFTAFSLLYIEFTSVFNSSKAVTGWIGSIYMASGMFLGIFFSSAVKRYGSRSVCIIGSVVTAFGLLISSFVTSVLQLYICYGLIAGSGVGMIVLSSQVLVLQYFEQRRALAAGIALSGYSFGALISGPLIHFMINTYAWRGTLTLISGIFLQIAVLGSLFRPPFEPRKVSTHKDGVLESSANGELRPAVDTNSFDDTGSKKQKHKLSGVCELCRRFFAASFNFSLLKDTSFCLYIISIFCVHIGLTTFLQHTPSRAVHYGVQPNLVAVLPTITGVSLGVSRIIFGFVANAPRFVDRMLQYGVTAALSGAVQMATGLATSFETMVVYCIVLGVCNGGFLAIITTLLVDLVGIENIGRSMSIWSLSVGAGILLSLPFAGFLFDISSNYNIPFIATGLFQVIGGLLGVSIHFIKRLRRS